MSDATRVPLQVAASGAGLVFATVVVLGLGANQADARGDGAPLVVRVEAGSGVAGQVCAAGRIEAAVQRAVAEAGAQGAQAVVQLAAGRFHLERPVRLGQWARGSWRVPLVVRGMGGGRTALSGSRVLREYAGDWSALKERLPAASRPFVKAYGWPAGISRPKRIGVRRFHGRYAGPVPFEVFDAQGALRPARWPDSGFAVATPLSNADGVARLVIEGAPFASWRGDPDLWLHGYLRHDWSFEEIGIASVDATAGAILLHDRPYYGLAARNRVFVSHALQALDAPGEWYLDHDRGVLLVWPRGGTAANDLRVSVAEGAFRLSGAAHVRVSDLTMLEVRGDAVVVDQGVDVLVERSEIRWAGGRGIVVRGAQASGVRASVLTDLGEGGVVLAGGDRALLRPGNQFVADSRFRRFSRLGRTYKPAVLLDGVGQRVAGNDIAEAPHMALQIRGNEHVVERNEIWNVVRETTDSGAIYAGRDLTARGTTIRHNFIHDVQARSGFEVKGIYLDDFASGFAVAGNVFLRVEQAVFIGGGRDNRIDGNVFVGSSPAVHLDARGLSWARAAVLDPHGALVRGLGAVPRGTGIWARRYPTLARLRLPDALVPLGNSAEGNLVVAGQALRLEAGVGSAGGPLERPGAFVPIKDGRAEPERARDARDLARRLRLKGTETWLAGIPFWDLDRRNILRRD